MTGILLIFGFLAIAVWGTLLGRRQRLVEYTSNRDRGSTVEVYSTTLSSLVGGWMFFGLNAVGYEAGLVGVAIGIGYAIGMTLLLILAPRIKTIMSRHGFDTLDEFIGLHFGRGTQSLVTLTNFAIFLSVLAAQFLAMTSYLTVIAPEFSGWLPLAAAGAVVIYTSIGGYKGVAITDIAKMILLVGGVGAFAAIVFGNTTSADWERLPQGHWTFTGYGPVFLVGALVLFPFTILVRSDLWQRLVHAESPRTARRALGFTIPSLFVFYILLTMIGMAARARLGDVGVSKESAGLLLLHRDIAWLPMPSWIGDVLIAGISLGIFAALASTADNNLNIAAIGLSKLFFAKDWALLKPGSESQISGEVEMRILRKCRLLCFAVGVVSIGAALAVRDIVHIMINVASVMMLFLPATIGALLWNHHSRWGGFASVVAGLVAYIASLVAGVDLKSAFVPGFAVSLLVYILAMRRATRRAEPRVMES